MPLKTRRVITIGIMMKGSTIAIIWMAPVITGTAGIGETSISEPAISAAAGGGMTRIMTAGASGTTVSGGGRTLTMWVICTATTTTTIFPAIPRKTRWL